MSDCLSTQTKTRRHACHRAVFLVLLLPLLGGCPWVSILEMTTPYDFQTDPDGDGNLAHARPLMWWGDTAIGFGGISIDPASSLALRSYLEGEEIVGHFSPPPGEIDIFSLGRLKGGDRISLAYSSLTEQIILASPVGQVGFPDQWPAKGKEVGRALP